MEEDSFSIEGSVSRRADKGMLKDAGTNAYFRIKNKPVIKFLVVTRYGLFSQQHDIAFLASDMKFYHFIVRLAQHIHYIAPTHIYKFKEMFQYFEIDSSTEVMIQDTVDVNSPISIYFELIRQYTKHKCTRVSLVQMVSRIYHYHRTFSKSVTAGKTKISIKTVNMYLYKAWNKLVKLGTCPWITKAADDKFKLMSAGEAKREMRARVCAYYMFVKCYFRNVNIRHEQKKLKMQQEAQ